MNSGDIQTYDYNKKKKIVYRIQNLKKRKIYIKLFKLILNENINYSTNNNGIFINVSKIPIDSLKKIDSFLNQYENVSSNVSDSSESMSESSLNLAF
tara:strand:- start:339 stop:629 length:291 start_codon:yes stop_codon:yes gene_type:complete